MLIDKKFFFLNLYLLNSLFNINANANIVIFINNYYLYHTNDIYLIDYLEKYHAILPVEYNIETIDHF